MPDDGRCHVGPANPREPRTPRSGTRRTGGAPSACPSPGPSQTSRASGLLAWTRQDDLVTTTRDQVGAKAGEAPGRWTRSPPTITVVTVRDVPWWGVASSAAAPVLMVAGWTTAAGLQHSFDPVADTVSALAAPGAADRWVMTATFVVVGACYFVTGLGLRPARLPGRLLLMAAAVTGLLVAAYPL